VEAQFLVDRMAESGIAAVSNGVNMGNTEYPINVFAPRIMVREEDFARARAFVKEYERRRRVRAGADE
jgi:hypothetical protein